MNDPRPYFPFYPADFWGSDRVALMDFEAAGLYLFLLSREWQQGMLSADEAVLKRLCAGRVTNWETTWAQVRPCFEMIDGKLVNRRLETERATADAFSARQSGNARTRWERFKKGTLDATALPPQCHGNATAMPRQDRTGQDRTGKDRTKKAAPAALVIPSNLDTPACRTAIETWIAYKRERHDAYKPIGLQGFLTKAAKLGPTVLVPMIETAIANNWAGIHPERNGQSKPAPTVNGWQPLLTPEQRYGTAQ